MQHNVFGVWLPFTDVTVAELRPGDIFSPIPSDAPPPRVIGGPNADMVARIERGEGVLVIRCTGGMTLNFDPTTRVRRADYKIPIDTPAKDGE